MPQKALVDLRFPVGGLNRRYAYRQQPPYTTPDCLNMRPFDVIEGRERGGSRPGLNLTYWDWLGGGTTINYFRANAYRPLEKTSDYDESLKGIIPTVINIGASMHLEKIFLPKWLIRDVTIAVDIRDLIVFKFLDGEPSYDKVFFRNIYMGLEAKLFDIPVIRNIIFLPLKLGFGFYQGNISFSLSGKVLWLFEIGIAVWGEEKSDRVGFSRVYNLAFMLEFGIGI